MPELGPPTAERRQDPRYPLHLTGSAEALYRRALEATYQDPQLRGQDRFKVETVNASRGGVMLAFDVEISPGDVLKLTFVHPETKAELTFEAQVQWMRKNATNLMGRFCAGAAFKNRDQEGIVALVGYASALHPTPLPFGA